MTPSQFLHLIWPDSGIYCIATPYKLKNTNKTVYRHRVFTSVDDAALFVKTQRDELDLFFALFTLKQERIWNATKRNERTGELGGYQVRTQANSHQVRCFFFDLDVGDDSSKYPDQRTALLDLVRFCKETGLPKPLVTSSGGGLHVYWVLTDSMKADEWRPQAARLRGLAKHHGLKCDPMRTTDTASVLRVVGTYNHKRGLKRAVEVLTQGTPSGNGDFLKRLGDAVTRAGIQVKVHTPFLPDMTGLGSNTASIEYEGAPVSFRALVTACAQVQYQVKQQGNVSEPEWFHTLNLIRHVENGQKIAHKYSQGYPAYNPADVDDKLAQLDNVRLPDGRKLPPTSCFKMAEVSKLGDLPCEGCWFTRRSSPLAAARFKDLAPPPTVTHMVGQVAHNTTIPDPPYPYTRLKNGGVAVTAKNKDGDETTTVIYPYDLYPIRRMVNAVEKLEQQTWRVCFDREGDKDFVLDSDAMYDKRKFAHTIANHGIYPQANQIQALQDYMTSYIAELQRLADAEAQHTHLGWMEDYTKFIMPDRVMLEDGTAKPAMLTRGAQRSTLQVHKKGTLERQVELLRFYEHPAYVAQQFFILASLAAPIFYMTGHHGVILNASGEAGASKSTSLYTAASMWGQPEMLPINGTANGATIKARNERISTFANLPIMVDEITHMQTKDAQDLAMGITQPGHRLRLEQNGEERAATDAYKATIMLCTANNSLHSLLSQDNAAGSAGSMRVVEVLFHKGMIHTKAEADNYWHELKQHYGHVGEVFISYVLQNRAAVEARIRQKVRDLDTAANIQSAERFWSALAADILVAGEIAHELGLVPYHIPHITKWVLETQIPQMRGVVREEYHNPAALLADYLETINGNILIMRKGSHAMSNLPDIQQKPMGQLLAHYDLTDKTMWVLKKGFKEWCTKVGANSLRVLDDLSAVKLDTKGQMSRIVTSKHIKKTLGAGTTMAKAQSWCFVINMDHPDIAEVDLTPVGAAKGRPQLKVVT